MMKKLDIYTSTGLKFWKHTDRIENYKNNVPYSIVTTHVSPEGICNLACSYCSVSKRINNQRIEFKVLQKYLEDVASLGCKAVIITGGGEPTIYPQFDLLIETLEKLKLQYALITNGTTIQDMDLCTKHFSWVRMSVNYNEYWQSLFLKQPCNFLPETTVGLSLVFSGENKLFTVEDLIAYADHCNAKYIRLLPNCLQDNSNLNESYQELDNWLNGNKDPRFMVQVKKHRAPQANKCHQSYFRPYLSEYKGGTIFPCDSVVLNDKLAHFNEKYALCPAEEIKEYLSFKIKQRFNPTIDCKGCVFTNSIEMIDRYINGQLIADIKESDEVIQHENFI